MKPVEFRKIRTKILRLSCAGLSRALKMEDESGRHIRKIEAGTTPIKGPIELCMTYFQDDEKYISQFRNKIDS